MTACRQQGYKGAFTTNVEVVNGANGLKVPDNTVVGNLLAFPWFADAPAVKPYVDAMHHYGVDSNSWQDNGAANVWASLELLRKAVNANQPTLPATVTAADLINVYGTIKNETLGGLLPQPVSFTANQPQTPLSCGFTYKLSGGKYTTIQPGLTPTCASSGS